MRKPYKLPPDKLKGQEAKLFDGPGFFLQVNVAFSMPAHKIW